jgi:hypothetical protein
MSQHVHMFGKVKGCGSLACVDHAAYGRPDRQIRKIRGIYGNTRYYGVLGSTQTPDTVLMPCLLICMVVSAAEHEHRTCS